jgi:hypothetical protein
MCSPLRQCVVPHALASDAKIPWLRASDSSSAESARARASHGFMIGKVEQTKGQRPREEIAIARDRTRVSHIERIGGTRALRSSSRACTLIGDPRRMIGSRSARNQEAPAIVESTRSHAILDRESPRDNRDGNRDGVSGSASRVGQGGAGCSSSQRAHDLERDWPRSIGSAQRGGSVLISGSLGVTEQRDGAASAPSEEGVARAAGGVRCTRLSSGS